MAAVLSLAILFLATQLSGQTTLKVIRGWGGKERIGRWNPVLMRVADARSRNVKLEFISPGQDGFATVIEEEFGIGRAPVTYPLLSPVHYSAWPGSVAVLRDADSGTIVAQFPQRIRQSTPNVPAVGPSQLFIGLSGRATLLEQATRILGGQLGYLPEPEIPRAALGFDALDVLFLNQSDLRRLDSDQQRAILDWVRQGGSLLLVPAETTVPADSILGASLPCRIGDVQPLTLPAEILQRAGIAARSAKSSSRGLQPSANAVSLELIKGSGINAYWAQRGLGRILVAPIDLGAIEFEESRERQGTLDFWQPIVQTLNPGLKPPEKLKYESPYNGYQSETREQQREGTAISTACDFLIPQPARVAWWRRLALLAMGILLIVGPLDSIVLKAVGRPHLTWTTIPGWMGFLALAAAWVSAAIAAPAPVTVRSLRVIDQVDDQAVGTTGVMAADSSHDAILQISGEEGWWDAVIPGSVDPAKAPAQGDLHLHESQQSCAPEQLRLDSGHPRFLRWLRLEPGAPTIRASLLLSASGGPPRLTGTIRNLSAKSLKDLHVRTALGVADIPLDSTGGRLQPQQETKVDVVANGRAFSTASFEARYQNYGYFGSRSYSTALKEQDLWAVVPDLAARRGLTIDQIIGGDAHAACIYAQVVDPAAGPEVTIEGKPSTAQFEWLRALVRLGE